MTATFNHLFHGAPPWLIAAAMIGVVIHVSAGCVGILTGAAAIAMRKGERSHRRWGTVFFGAMLTMAGVAATLAVTLMALGVSAQAPNAFASTFTFYLVGTAWMTVRRPEHTIGALEIAAPVFGLGVAAVAVFVILPLTLGPVGRASGVPVAAPIIFASVALLAAALDFKVVLTRGIAGAPRIARHLWRMCVGWFIATGSFFLGQQKEMPQFMRGSPVLIALGVAPLVLMLFWLAWVAFSRQFKQPALAPA